MADRYFNRDRNRPYAEDYDYDEDFYDQDWGNRGNYNYDRDYARTAGMRGRGGSDYGWDRNYGRYGGGFNRGQYNPYNRGMSPGYAGYGSRFNRDYDYDFDYDYEPSDYNRDYGRWNRGYYGRGANYGGGYNRGSSYGGGYGNYGRGYSGGYGSYGRGSSNYGQGFNRGYNQSRYGGGGYGSSDFGGYGMDYDTDYDYDYDYDSDYDFSPTTWTYEEIWLIPGPFSGVGPQDYQRSDDRIREDINDRLTQHGRLNARNIQAQVNNGEVTLTGTVDRRSDKRTAEDVVESVTGVRDVHNQIKVQERQKNPNREQQQIGQQSSMGQQQGHQQNRERQRSSSSSGGQRT